MKSNSLTNRILIDVFYCIIYGSSILYTLSDTSVTLCHYLLRKPHIILQMVCFLRFRSQTEIHQRQCYVYSYRICLNFVWQHTREGYFFYFVWNFEIYCWSKKILPTKINMYVSSNEAISDLPHCLISISRPARMFRFSKSILEHHWSWNCTRCTNRYDICDWLS